MARNICAHSFRSPGVRELPVLQGVLNGHPVLDRTATQPWLRSDIKSRFRLLQERLSPHEQLILSLRVERGLSWTEAAQAMAGRPLSPKEAHKRAAVLRQQFQRIKSQLRALAVDEQLLESWTHP
ncbi:hypothetical protein [Hyalangium sp.]|uniref:hypothetical protein n=1 Tax=Hyalangium sp. TaxID=2028555 RepID=UPI002D54F937|nr:hypothetical protein [Hyalangium sp.]HYH97923.1 hypothetical protein [Hyalangium sp.]